MASLADRLFGPIPTPELTEIQRAEKIRLLQANLTAARLLDDSARVDECLDGLLALGVGH